MLKVVDIVQGFLGSGKTSLINHLIQNIFLDEVILVVLTEWGKTEVIHMGQRTMTYSWDWEQGFPLEAIRQIIKMENIQRIIFEVNGFASGQELIDVLTELANEGQISLGAKMAVFNGPQYNLLGESLKSIFYKIALTSDGFWINEGNSSMCKWLHAIQPSGYQTTGDDWKKWYLQTSKPQKKSIIKQLIPYIAMLIIIYSIFFFQLKTLFK